MTEPRGRPVELDGNTASAMEDDPDFGSEHTRPTVADDQERPSDESVPEGRGGDGGMDPV